jgi:signal transduction histidine kinase
MVRRFGGSEAVFNGVWDDDAPHRWSGALDLLAPVGVAVGMVSGYAMPGLIAITVSLALSIVTRPLAAIPIRALVALLLALLLLAGPSAGARSLVDPAEDALLLGVILLVGVVGRIAFVASRAHASAAVAELREIRDRIIDIEVVNRTNLCIAHDLRNVFTVVNASALDLKDEMSGRRGAAFVHEILQATERGLAFTYDLAVPGRDDGGLEGPLDLRRVTRQIEPMLRRLATSAVDLRVDYDDQPVCARLDHTGLLQVMMNLVSNARDAMCGNGNIRIQCRRGSHWSETAADLVPTAVLRISDDGPGVSPAARGQMFDAGFSTKSGVHWGLGLSVVREVVDRYQGWIDVDSSSIGTTVSISFPLAVPNLALVVVRSDWARRMLADELRDGDFEVVEAADPVEVCDLVTGLRTADVVVLDADALANASLCRLAHLNEVRHKLVFGDATGMVRLPATRAEAAELVTNCLAGSDLGRASRVR